MVRALVELLELELASIDSFLLKIPGLFGSSKSISLPNIKTTELIVGLSSGYC